MKRISFAIIPFIAVLIAVLVGASMTSAGDDHPSSDNVSASVTPLTYTAGPGSSHMWYGVAAMIAAEATDLESLTIVEQWEAGESLADIAVAHDVDPDVILETITSQTARQLDHAVAGGRMTRPTADEYLGKVTQMATWALTMKVDQS